MSRLHELRKDTFGGVEGVLAMIGVFKLMLYFGIVFMIMSVIGVLSGKFMLMMGFLVIIFIVMMLIIVVISQPKGKGWIIFSGSIAILVILAAVMLGWFGNFEMKPGDFSTTSWSNVDMPNKFHIYAEGYYNDPDGYHNGKAGEYLDSIGYTTSWRSGGLPEKVYWTGTLCGDNDVDAVPGGSQLHVRFTSGSSWPSEPVLIDTPKPAVNSCSSGGSVVGPVLINIPTEFKNGWMKVDWHLSWTFGDLGNYQNYRYHAATDMAEVRDGMGLITKPVALKKVIVGESFDIEFRLGSACASSEVGDGQTQSNGGGWSYLIYSEGQGKQVDGGDLGCGGTTTPQYKTVSYTPSSDDFNPVGGECRTKLRIELYSSFFMKDKVDVRTLDLSRAFALPRPTLKLSSYGAHVGDSITASVDPGAGYEHDWVVKHEDGTIIYEETNNATDIDFEVPKAGKYTVSVNCIASDCSVSDPDSAVLIVQEQGDNSLIVDPNWLLVIIILIVVIILIALLWVYAPIPVWLKFLLTFLIVAIVFAVTWWMGLF